MFKEFEKGIPRGKLFRPTKEQDKAWCEYASQELGLTGTRGKRLNDMIASNARWG